MYFLGALYQSYRKCLATNIVQQEFNSLQKLSITKILFEHARTLENNEI